MLSTELAGGEKLRMVSEEEVSNLRHASPWPQNDTLDHETTARIGTALNSDLLVLGSYTTIGRPNRGQLRLDVRLQEAKTGEILTEIAEIGGAQDLFQVVARIGGKLRGRLGVAPLENPDEASVLSVLPTDPEAARFYSLGLVKLREYDYPEARGLFEQAIKAEPKFPLAHSMLSRADIFLGHDDQAKAEAKRGLAAAKTGIGGHTGLTAAGQKIRAVIQESHRLGLYYTECEARLAQGELEMKLDPASGRTQLTALAFETRSRGLELLARQAEHTLWEAGGAAAASKPSGHSEQLH